MLHNAKNSQRAEPWRQGDDKLCCFPAAQLPLRRLGSCGVRLCLLLVPPSRAAGAPELALSTSEPADAVRARSPQRQRARSPLGKGALSSPSSELSCWEGAGGHRQEAEGLEQARRVPTSLCHR